MERYVALKFVVEEILTAMQAQFFPYFIVTLTAFVTIPVTYSLLKPSKGACN